MTDNVCKNCKFWCPASEFANPDDNLQKVEGECRKRAPLSPFKRVTWTWEADGQHFTGTHQHNFAPTFALDWCGEFQRR